MVILTDCAIKDLNTLIINARLGSKNSVKKYINEILNYIDILNIMPNLGKKLYYKNRKIEIRQLIYKKHRIIYQIKNKQLYILAIIHIKQNFKKFIYSLKLYS